MAKGNKVGMEINQSHIHISTIKAVQSNYESKFHKSYKIPEIKNEKEYFAFMRRCLKDFSIFSKMKFMNLSISVPYDDDSIHVKFLTLPTKKRSIVQKTLKYEIAEQELAESIDSIYYTWQDTHSDAATGQHDIVLLTVRKKLIRQLAKLQSINFKIENIEIHPISIGRLMYGNVAYLHFLNDRTNLYLYLDGRIAHVSSIDFNEQSIDSKIHEIDHYITKENLAEIKKKIFISNEYMVKGEDEDLNLISDNVTTDVNAFLQEVKKIIRSFELQKSIIVEQIFYGGENSQIKYLDEAIYKEIDVPAKKLEFLINEEVVNEDPVDFTVYSIASSATLFEKYDYLKDLNLQRYTKYQFDLAPFLITVLVIATMVNTGTFLINKNYDNTIMEMETAKLQQDSIIAGISEEINVVNNIIASNNMEISTIQQSKGLRKWLSDILYVLPEKMPKDVAITSIDTKPGQIVLNGYSKNYSDIGFLAIELEKYGTVVIERIDNEIETTGRPVGIVSAGLKEADVDIESDDFVQMERGFKLVINYSDYGRLNNDLVITSPEDIVQAPETIMPIDPSQPSQPPEVPGETYTPSDPEYYAPITTEAFQDEAIQLPVENEREPAKKTSEYQHIIK